MNARIERLRADIRSDVAAMSRQLDVLAATPIEVDSPPAVLALAAWALHHAYTALESALERVARALEGGLPSGPDWHRDLLQGAFREVPNVRPAVLDPAIAHAMHDLRGFRHVVRHA
jgi:hypothetical protein